MFSTESRDSYRSAIRLLFVGGPQEQQGLHLLLQALKYVSGYELSVLGDGSERENLQSFAIGLNFQFCGPDANRPHYYRYADIFIAPSLGPEVLHSVTVEAMSHGLPCILSDLPAYKELSNNGAAAMLFKCGDSAALRSCLHTLLSSESERRRYGTAAYETIVNKHAQMSLVPLISGSSDCAALRWGQQGRLQS